ncbi:MAG: hypothetical protein LBS50_05050 [Prevotellaceae bacterium]|jgi:hypothetical protein|nr:hypothetical protein [Prevotellaceae bacterium]
MQNKKFKVIEEGRLSAFEMSAIKGGTNTNLEKKCSKFIESCSKVFSANCKLYCWETYQTNCDGKKYEVCSDKTSGYREISLASYL